MSPEPNDIKVAVERPDGVTEIVQAQVGYLCGWCAKNDHYDETGLGLCHEHAQVFRSALTTIIKDDPDWLEVPEVLAAYESFLRGSPR